MQEAGRLLEKDEVVVEAPSGDEGILARANSLSLGAMQSESTLANSFATK
jgi:hypothetical protein